MIIVVVARIGYIDLREKKKKKKNAELEETKSTRFFLINVVYSIPLYLQFYNY